jgi:hypothetical protein
MPPQRARRLGAAAVVAVLATLLNPYGFEALSHPFSIVGSEALWRAYIIEWNPPVLFTEQPFNPAIFGYVLIVQIVAAAAACVLMPRRVDLTDGLLFASTLVMALSARRFVPIFSLVGAAFFARTLVLLRDRFGSSWSRAIEGATPIGMRAVALFAVGGTALVVVDAIPVARMVRARGLFDVLVGGDYFPTGAIEFLRANRLPGAVFHPYTRERPPWVE